MLFALDWGLKLPASLNGEFLRKLSLINLVKRNPTPILPLGATTLLKLSSGFFDAIYIKDKAYKKALPLIRDKESSPLIRLII